IGDLKVAIPEDKWKSLDEQGYNGKELVLGVRPEDIYDASQHPELSTDTNIEITVDVAELMGSDTVVYGLVNNQNIVDRIDARTGITQGLKMKLHFDMENAHFFDKDSEQRLTQNI